MRIALVGSRGQLGSAVLHACRDRHDVTPLPREVLDIASAAAVTDVMSRLRPEVIINCAGYNAVDAAETHPVDALQANAFAVRALARAACDLDATLVHFSSDFVFDGRATAPVDEQVAPNPRSAYAASKLLGEWFAADAPRAFVLRVESLFGAGPGGPDKGSLAAIVSGIRAGALVKVFGDRTVSPTHVGDAADATLALLERRAEPGVYHVVNSGFATWQAVGQEAARLLCVEARFDVVSVHDVRLPAARPQFCALSNARLTAALGHPVATWQDALARYVAATRG